MFVENMSFVRQLCVGGAESNHKQLHIYLEE